MQHWFAGYTLNYLYTLPLCHPNSRGREENKSCWKQRLRAQSLLHSRAYTSSASCLRYIKKYKSAPKDLMSAASPRCTSAVDGRQAGRHYEESGTAAREMPGIPINWDCPWGRRLLRGREPPWEFIKKSNAVSLTSCSPVCCSNGKINMTLPSKVCSFET